MIEQVLNKKLLRDLLEIMKRDASAPREDERRRSVAPGALELPYPRNCCPTSRRR